MIKPILGIKYSQKKMRMNICWFIRIPSIKHGIYSVLKILNSTRRLSLRPAAVVFGAIGWVGP